MTWIWKIRAGHLRLSRETKISVLLSRKTMGKWLKINLNSWDIVSFSK